MFKNNNISQTYQITIKYRQTQIKTTSIKQYIKMKYPKHIRTYQQHIKHDQIKIKQISPPISNTNQHIKTDQTNIKQISTKYQQNQQHINDKSNTIKQISRNISNIYQLYIEKHIKQTNTSNTMCCCFTISNTLKIIRTQINI